MVKEREIEIKQRIRLRMEKRRRQARNRRIIKLLAGLSLTAVCATTYFGLTRSAERQAIEAQAATVGEMAGQPGVQGNEVPGLADAGTDIRVMGVQADVQGQAGLADAPDKLGSHPIGSLARGIQAMAETQEQAGADDGAPADASEWPDIEAVYAAHIAQRGWSPLGQDNTYCMATGGSYVTNIKATLKNQPEGVSGTLRYKVNLSGSGWMDWAENAAELGSPDGVIPLEAIAMELNGELAAHYDVYYSVLQDAAWTGWSKNGEEAGISGAGKRVDGVRVSIRKKDAGEPGETQYLNGVDPTRPMVALTYDDGPSDNATPRILATLKQNGGRATFFMVGNRVASHAGIVQQMVAQGSEVANHSYDHAILTKIGSDGVMAQIGGANQAVAAACGVTPKLMRPPGGGYNENVRANMVALGMPAILWSVDTLDWKTRNAQSTIEKALGQVKDGDIILMHDLYTATADASDVIIPELVKRGYQLVTVSELAEYRGGMVPGGRYGQFRP